MAAAALTVATTGLPGVPMFGLQAVQAQQVNVSFNVFFTQLQPLGVWVRHADFNFVWCPTGLPANWRPYTNGRWVFTSEFGWFFQSDEPFAWATYHYGRWLADPRLGWCWVPGTQWAPAWVTWRSSGDVIGWAPLPPTRPGFVVDVNVNVTIVDANWIFVPVVRFVDPNLRVVVIVADQNPTFVRQTEFLGPVVVQNNVVINNVINVNFIEEQANVTVPVFTVAQSTEPVAPAVDGTTLEIYTGNVEEPTPEDVPPDAVEVDEAAEVIAENETEPVPEPETVEEAESVPPAEDTTGAEGEAVPETADDTEAAEEAPADDGAVAPEDAAAEPDGEAADPGADEAPAEDPDAADVPADGEGLPAELECAPEELVDGVCPEIDDATPEEEVVEEVPAEEAAEEPAPVEEAAPAEEPAPPEEPAQEEAAPEEEPVVDEAPAEEAAPAEEQPAEEAAPAEEEAAPEEAAPAPEPIVCPEGQILDERGLCVPLTDDAGEAPAESEVPAQ